LLFWSAVREPGRSVRSERVLQPPVEQPPGRIVRQVVVPQQAMTLRIPKAPGMSCESAAPPFGITSEAACLSTRDCLACNARRGTPAATPALVGDQPNKDHPK